MWFDTTAGVLRTLAVGAAAYVWLVLVLRVSGKRTLAKLNAFDLVVTVALGSTLATILLSADVAWAEGAAAVALLAFLQFAVAWVTSRWPAARAVTTASPTVLLRDGVPRADALQAQRVTEAELRQACRSSGAGDLGLVAWVVLETDGSLSVITSQQAGDGSALRDVPG
jgi:uncharacterized membrane protein YcaP (DUF421 family)